MAGALNLITVRLLVFGIDPKVLFLIVDAVRVKGSPSRARESQKHGRNCIQRSPKESDSKARCPPPASRFTLENARYRPINFSA